MSTTTDYSVSPKIDKDLEDDLRRSLRTERKLKTARGEEKGKVAAWEKTMKAKNEVEVAKTKSRPKRYVRVANESCENGGLDRLI